MFSAVLLVLVLKLDSPSFVEREKARESLISLGPLAMPALNFGKKHSLAEGRLRCTSILKLLFWDVCYKQADTFSHPIISSVGVYEYKAYISWAKSLGFRGKECFREATKLWIAAQLYRGVDESEINSRLNIMDQHEAAMQGLEPVYPRAH